MKQLRYQRIDLAAYLLGAVILAATVILRNFGL